MKDHFKSLQERIQNNPEAKRYAEKLEEQFFGLAALASWLVNFLATMPPEVKSTFSVEAIKEMEKIVEPLHLIGAELFQKAGTTRDCLSKPSLTNSEVNDVAVEWVQRIAEREKKYLDKRENMEELLPEDIKDQIDKIQEKMSSGEMTFQEATKEIIENMVGKIGGTEDKTEDLPEGKEDEEVPPTNVFNIKNYQA